MQAEVERNSATEELNYYNQHLIWKLEWSTDREAQLEIQNHCQCKPMGKVPLEPWGGTEVEKTHHFSIEILLLL